MTASKSLRLGVALLAVYALAAGFTLHFGPLHVRPLYDTGPSTPPPYQWVNPPAALKKGNVKPKGAAVPVAWTAQGNEADSPSSPDGQAFVSLPAKAIAPHPPDDGAEVSFEPLDPATLAPVPGGLHPDGNAYKIIIEYSPSKTPVPTLGKTANILVRWATNGSALMYSPDGKAWRALDGVQVAPSPQALVSADWAGNGYYLPAGHGVLVPATHNGPPWVQILVGLLIALPLAGIVYFVFPRRQKPAVGKAAPVKKPPARKQVRKRRR